MLSGLESRATSLGGAGVHVEVESLDQVAWPRFGETDKSGKEDVQEIIALHQHIGLHRRSHAVLGVIRVIVVENVNLAESYPRMAARGVVEPVVVERHFKESGVR